MANTQVNSLTNNVLNINTLNQNSGLLGVKRTPEDFDLRNVFDGIEVYMKIMKLQADLATIKTYSMNKFSERSRESQSMANRLEAVNQDLLKPDSKGQVPLDAFNYAINKGILISSKAANGEKTDIRTYIFNNMDIGTKTTYNMSVPHAKDLLLSQYGLTKGELMTIKSALDADANTYTDLVNQFQVEINKLMQSFNVVQGIVSSMQTMLKDTNLAIQQKV